MDILLISNNLDTYLIIAAALFGIGFYGLMQRPTLIGMLISSEFILCGAAVNFMAFNHFLAPDPAVGQVVTLFIMGLAAAEAAIAMSIIIAVYRNYKSIDVGELVKLKG